MVDAVRFEPQGEHKIHLPGMVRGVPSPNADNWSYEGCRFYVGSFPVMSGDWIVSYSEGGATNQRVVSDEDFRNAYIEAEAAPEVKTLCVQCKHLRDDSGGTDKFADTIHIGMLCKANPVPVRIDPVVGAPFGEPFAYCHAINKGDCLQFEERG